MNDVLQSLLKWWSHLNIVYASICCVIGFFGSVWMIQTYGAVSKVRTAAVVVMFTTSMVAGASVANQVMDDAQRLDVQARAQNGHPIYTDGWWYAINSSAGNGWTKAFRSQSDCERLIDFLQNSSFMCKQRSDIERAVPPALN